mmetsp:Transcript_6860/g.7518  ORF Transcript_6860/g.7518 Transcript_6860/m.7518 type:complete len:87 (+) Transcript_6860:804-1064(+)
MMNVMNGFIFGLFLPFFMNISSDFFFLSGKDLAKSYGCPFVETSAKRNQNIDKLFFSLIDQIWEGAGGPPFSNKKGKGRKKDCQIL